MRVTPPQDIRPEATGSSKKPDRKPPGSQLLSIERRVSGRIGLPLLPCWPPVWVSGAGAEAVVKGVHAFGLVQRWPRERCLQSRHLDFPEKTPARASEAWARPVRSEERRVGKECRS